jgi:hypothetical protein
VSSIIPYIQWIMSIDRKTIGHSQRGHVPA